MAAEFRHFRPGLGQIHVTALAPVTFEGEAAILQNSIYAYVISRFSFVHFLRPVA
jgi:hypothetical protein